MDPLSEFSPILKPESYLTAGLDAGGDWAIRFGNRPGTIKCHAVTAGACWLAVDGMDAEVRLTAGIASSCRAAALHACERPDAEPGRSARRARPMPGRAT